VPYGAVADTPHVLGSPAPCVWRRA